MNNVNNVKSPIYLILCLSVLFGLSVFSQNMVKLYERNTVLKEAEQDRLVGERSIMDFYRTIPLESLMNYKQLKIIRRTNKEDFEVLSVVDGELVNADVLWTDYAVFKDSSGKYIARTAPCLTHYTDDAILKTFCEKQAYKNWFQYQFWKKKNLTRSKPVREKWIFKQRLIPEGAQIMEICSDQVITVYKSKEFGNVDRIQHVCSEPFDLIGSLN